MSKSCARRRSRLIALMTVTAVCASPLVPAAASDTPGWQRPVSGPVVRPFKEPIARFAAGHRGVDFRAAPGTPVRAANNGTVTFAGTVADALHVVIAHPGGIRTSYSFLARVDVHVGQTVRRGQVIGASGGSGPEHSGQVLHLGARVGDRYIDPMLLFGPVDLTQLVRLIPTEPRPTISDEEALRREFAERFGDDAGGCGIAQIVCDGFDAAADAVDTVSGWVADGAHAALDLGLDFLRAAGRVGRAIADQVAKVAHELLDRLPALVKALGKLVVNRFPILKALYLLYKVGSVFYKWASQDCDHDAPAANGRGGSGHWVMAVGGIDSHRDARRGAHGDAPRRRGSFGFEWQRLGYQRSDVEWYSYRKDSAVYSKRDTYKREMRNAALLAQQLRTEAADHPGKPVDLIAHSQGGRVVQLFLEFFWKDHQADYPELGKVIFFSSPLKGTPAADIVQSLRSNPGADEIARMADDLDAPGPDLRSPALEDLAESSDQSKYLAKKGLPDGVDALAIAGALDPIVPNDDATIDGAKTYLALPGNPVSPFDDHSGILHDDAALSAARAFLEDRKLPCMGLDDFAAAEAGSLVLGGLERSVANAVKAPPHIG